MRIFSFIILIFTMCVNLIGNNYQNSFPGSEKLNFQADDIGKGRNFSFSLNVAGGMGTINNQNISSLSLEKNYHKWTLSDNRAYQFSFNINHRINQTVGFNYGLGYKTLSTKYSITSDDLETGIEIIDATRREVFFDPNFYYLNQDADPYHKILEIQSYDSLINLGMIYIPLFLDFNAGKNVKFGISAGVDINMILFSEYKVVSEGSSYFIYLPEAFDGLGLMIFPQDGDPSHINLYEQLPYTKIENKIDDIKNVYIDGVLGLDVKVPLGSKFAFNTGGYYKMGLMDISKNKDDYVDIFGQTEDDLSLVPDHVFKHKPVKTSMLIFHVGLEFKF